MHVIRFSRFLCTFGKLTIAKPGGADFPKEEEEEEDVVEASDRTLPSES